MSTYTDENPEIREPATDAETVVERHETTLWEWADRDDRLGAIARAALRAGGEDV